MIRTIIWYFKFFFTLFMRYPELKKAEKLLKSGNKDEFYKYSFNITSQWAMQRIKDSGANIHINGKKNIPLDKNVLFISNHQSDFDIAIFMALIPTNKVFLAKSELTKIPILRTWMKLIGCIFIDRRDTKQSLNAILQASKTLKKGRNLVIFPEGTRSKGSNMNEFKQGAFKIAIKNKVPIVPITIDGSYKLKEKNGGIIKPENVFVYIHKAIYTENLSEDEAKNIHKTVQDIIKSKIANI